MSVITLTKANFDDIIANNDLVVVDFWAPWCEPCKSFGAVFNNVAAQHTDIIFGSINVDEETELSTDFNIRSIPALLVLRQRIAVYAESGAMSAIALNDLITQAKALDMDQVRKQLEETK